MLNQLSVPKINKLAVFLALFYAFSTRTIVGPLLFSGAMPLIYYGLTYICLIYCFLKSFVVERPHLYGPNGLFSIFLIFFVIFIGLIRSDSLHTLLYYGIALLLPFALKPMMKNGRAWALAFVTIGLILTIGCIINYVFPTIYRAVIVPLFTANDQANLEWQAEYGTAFPGFTSQVGYTSFFLSIAIGTLFCFRKDLFRRTFIPLMIALFFGFLLTGKRGPFAYVIVSALFVYFCESYGKEKFYRLIEIILIVIGIYALMYFLATYSGNASIERIFSSIQDLITRHDIEDVGRDQLRNQAMIYFSEHPIFGIGWDNYMKLFTLRSTHVHCIYVQLLCETGIIGFVIFVIFFGSSLIHTLQKTKRAVIGTYEYSWLMLSVYIQLYFLLYGITGNPLYDVEETIIYLFAVGIGFMPLLTDYNFANIEVR